MLRYLQAVLYAEPGPRQLLRATRSPVLPRSTAPPEVVINNGSDVPAATSALTPELVKVAQSWMQVHVGERYVPRNFFSAAVLGTLDGETTCDVMDRCVHPQRTAGGGVPDQRNADTHSCPAGCTVTQSLAWR